LFFILLTSHKSFHKKSKSNESIFFSFPQLEDKETTSKKESQSPQSDNLNKSFERAESENLSDFHLEIIKSI
jgi:hypothetical protein